GEVVAEVGLVVPQREAREVLAAGEVGEVAAEEVVVRGWWSLVAGRSAGGHSAIVASMADARYRGITYARPKFQHPTSNIGRYSGAVPDTTIPLDIVPYWREIHEHVLHILDIIPEDKLNWTPKPELWNSRGILIHIADARDNWLT